MTTPNGNMKIKIYSIPFMSYPISCNEEKLRHAEYLLETDMSIFTKETYSNLKKNVAPSKIDMRDLCMIIDFENGKTLFMDGRGVIRFYGASYYTFPWLFVYLLSVATVQKEMSKGVKEVYIRL